MRKHRSRLLATARAHGVREIRLFGSFASGDALPASDVALLVELEPGKTLLDLVAFRREAETILGITVDVATSDMLKDRVLPDVLAEACRYEQPSPSGPMATGSGDWFAPGTHVRARRIVAAFDCAAVSLAQRTMLLSAACRACSSSAETANES